MEMVINNKSFVAMSEFDMFEIDGGAWGWKQWTAAGLIVVGGACAVVGTWCPGLWGISGKAWTTAGAILSTGGGVLAIG